MKLEAIDVAVAGPHATLLEPTSLVARSGAVTVVMGYPGAGQVALALALGGRLPLTTGRVLLDGGPDAKRMRRVVALVDAPGVTEPEPALPTGSVVGEELAIAGHKAWRADVRSWLTRRGRRDQMPERFEALPPESRLPMLAELARANPAIEALVFVMPDRHGLAPSVIWEVAADAAAHGLAVVVTVAVTTGEQLPGTPARIGTRISGVPEPVPPIPTEPDVDDAAPDAAPADPTPADPAPDDAAPAETEDRT